tara:strand:- start:468 stop:1934 length:1467 start_codon:yes stop_codon:yes gene_type:complete
MNIKKKVLVFYPPSKLYQRGEDRSQGNVEDSSATTMRAPNDLGYASATLRDKNYEVKLKDYQSENLKFSDLKTDFETFKPDVIFVSITNATIYDDLSIIDELLGDNTKTTVIIKGALFFNPDDAMLKLLPLKNIDYLVGGESDFMLAELIQTHFEKQENLKNIRGISFKKNGEWIKTDFSTWENDLDSLVFPDRSEIKNKLYVRPDTGEAQATIVTSRGCPSKCIFCLTPTISGTKLRLRSPENIHEEIVNCYEKHNIRNFFFRSDTFTIDRRWVEQLCNLIMKSKLEKKISWVANSRVKPLQKETLEIMKQAGCWLVAFGYESGSRESLEKIKKGCSLEDNINAAKWAKEAGLKTFGFFLIGLPWEDYTHLNDTKKLIYQTASDFIEIHLAVPYYGTPLYELAKDEGLIDESVLGKDYFNSPTIGTKYLTMKQIEEFKRKLLLTYHFRPKYLMDRFIEATTSYKVFMNYSKYGVKLFKNNILRKRVS